MKRHPALQPLSREHHHLLLHARAIRWLVDGDPRADPASVVAADFHHYWAHDGLRHFAVEESIWLPAADRHDDPRTAQLAASVRAGHQTIRQRIASLPPAPMGDEALSALGTLGRMLHDQIRFEERRFFAHLQAVWSDERFDQLAARAAAFRTQWVRA